MVQKANSRLVSWDWSSCQGIFSRERSWFLGFFEKEDLECPCCAKRGGSFLEQWQIEQVDLCAKIIERGGMVDELDVRPTLEVAQGGTGNQDWK